MAGLSGNEYSELRAKLDALHEMLRDKCRSAKAASKIYPARAPALRGEADAYDDAADELKDVIKALPK